MFLNFSLNRTTTTTTTTTIATTPTTTTTTTTARVVIDVSKILDFFASHTFGLALFRPRTFPLGPGVGFIQCHSPKQAPPGPPQNLNPSKINQKSIKNHKKQKWSRNGQRNELSTSRYHRSARNFATILMVRTVLRVTELKILNFSWSEPEIH